MRGLVLSLLLLFAVNSGTSQTIDQLKSLKQKLLKSKMDTNRVELLLQLSRQYLQNAETTKIEIDSSISSLKQADKLAAELKYTKGTGKTRLTTALIYKAKKDTARVIAFSQQALSIFKRTADPAGEGDACMLLGEHDGNYDRQFPLKIAWYNKSVAAFKKAGDKLRMASTLEELAGEFENVNRNKEGLKTAQQALKIYKTVSYKKLQGVYNLMGVCSTFLGDWTNGVKYGLLAASTAEAIGDTSVQLSDIYNSLGLTYQQMSQDKQALIYYQKALDVARKHHDNDRIVSVAINRAYILINLHKFSQALSCLLFVDKVKTGIYGYRRDI